ncbi:MAG: DUF4258 domain-containing protein [Patescibacteria group bacterium]
MKIRYTRHALARMSARGITKKLVAECLIAAQKIEQQPGGSLKFTYRNKGKKLVVIHEKNKENYTIITAYYEN